MDPPMRKDDRFYLQHPCLLSAVGFSQNGGSAGQLMYDTPQAKGAVELVVV